MRALLFLLCLFLNAWWPTAHAAQKPLLLVSFDYPPFMAEDAAQNAQSGLAVDIVVEAFRRMNTPVRIVFYPLARGLAIMEAGKADGMFTIKKNPERDGKFLFPAHPLINQDYVIFVRKDSKIVFDGDIKSLKNLSIGVLNKAFYGTVFDRAVQSGQFKKLEIANSHEQNFVKLLGRRMDAVVCSRAVGVELLKRLDAENEVIVSGPAIQSVPSYLMFRRQSVTSEFVRQFDAILNDMQEDGTLADIEKRYPH